jgi:hypothetical protein
MATRPNDKRKHIVPSHQPSTKPFTAHPPDGFTKQGIPELTRAQQAAILLRDLSALNSTSQRVKTTQEALQLEGGIGIQVQFVGRSDVELSFEQLSNDTQQIELLSVVKGPNGTIANVFVPDGKLVQFEKYVTAYLEEKTNKAGKPMDHRVLIDTIASIRAAEIRGLWNDDHALLPADQTERFWWEVWLPVRGKKKELRDEIVADFKKLVTAVGCEVGSGRADFPERVVVLMFGSEQQLSQSVHALNCVAELRRAKETAAFFSELSVTDQRGWQEELLSRTAHASPNETVPRVCLIDSGVNRAHPLLAPAILESDLHTVEEAFGVHDAANHGTGMASLALYGDLVDALESTERLQIDHLLESVKLTPGAGGNIGGNELHADLFSQAVNRPEISAPLRPRVFSSAVTSIDFRDRGRPSSWSSMVDRLTSDADGDGEFPRLVVQSAGNETSLDAWAEYPSSISTNLIHDPGQAWNALTVGAYTQKARISESDADGYAPIAPAGGLSPMTSSSSTWDRAWPLKPDVVFEGGNAARDAYSAVTLDSLMLLAAHNNIQERLFTTSNATSAASALCSRMSAQLMCSYPMFRPETIRALIVHSAEWTPAMRRAYLPTPNKPNHINLIRHCGWGVPNLERALWSASNSLTLVVEDELQPYWKQGGKIKTKEMRLHDLPWPKDELEALGDMQVEMRVTLSYFVEPNPSSRGSSSKYHYPSHRLRFDVRHPLESASEFAARVNAAAEQEDANDQNPKDPAWALGALNRHKGSLHQDVWRGTAAELANRGSIAVYPGQGWWRTRAKLGRFDSKAKYSLLISIRTPATNVDLYNVVAVKAGVLVESEIG